jgi:ABC-2 type transport system permease protein
MPPSLLAPLSSSWRSHVRRRENVWLETDMFDALVRTLALVRKELLAVLKDPKSRISLFVPPIFQCLVFGYAATYDLGHIPYAAVDEDRSEASRQFLARLDGSRLFSRVVDLVREDDIASAIDTRRALLVVRIPQDFERRLSAKEAAPVQVIADGRNSNTAATALGYINTIVDSFNIDWRAAHGLPDPPLTLVTRAWFNPALETRWNMVPALMGTLTMLQTLLLTAMSVAREREEGTFDQLLVTPLRPSEIMIGKALPSMLVGLVQATGILLVAQLWFRIPFAGSFVTLYTGLALFLLAGVGIGLLVSSVVATMQQAMLFSFVILMPCTLLSGLTTPIHNMPQVLRIVTLVNPLRYAIDIAHRVYLEGATLVELVPQLGPLALISGITLPTAAYFFRKRVM